MFRTLFVGVCVLCTLIASGQYPYPKEEHANQVMNKILAVQLLKAESEVEVALNEMLKEAFNETYTGEVAFFKPSQMEKLIRKDGETYSFLRQPETLKEDLRLDMSYVDGSYHQWILGGGSNPDDLAKMTIGDFVYQEVNLDYYQFILYVVDGKKEKEVTSITFANGRLGKHDYVFLAQQLNVLLSSSSSGIMRADFVDVESNINTIKSGVCYFLQDYFDEETRASFADYYDHAYELVDFAGYQDLIAQRKQNASYVKIIFSFQHNKYMWVIVNASDGRILALNDIGDYKFTGTFDAQDLIKPRHLKHAVNLDTQLLNNYYNK